ncbi:MBL fold metallo-hydrolase [bacterium]|nr:MBL fold metallo-hydrolase [bacterium]
MEIIWYGHSSFAVIDNKKLITDPYIHGSFGGAVGYSPIDESADIVTASHKHEDHYGINTIKGNPVIIDKKGVFEREGFHIEMMASFHDDKKGALRGENLIAKIISPSGIKIIHFGDQGVIPNENIMQNIKDADIVLIPIGGTFTIDHKEAFEIIRLIGPKIVIPMHYKTEKLGFDIDTVNNFLSLFGDYSKVHTLNIEKGGLADFNKNVFVLDHVR